MSDKPQIENRTLFTGDNLEVMRAVNSETVDLIYLDPPFNKKFVFPIGKGKDAKFGFTDIWGFGKGKDDPYLQEAELAAYSELLWASELFDSRPQEIISKKDAKNLLAFLELTGRIADESAMAYLSFMAIRLLEMKRVLKPTGSIYLHCDQTMSHSLKLLMDIVFGGDNFRREIIWRMGEAVSGYKARAANWIRNSDNIFYYHKGDPVFNKQLLPHPKEWVAKHNLTDEEYRRYYVLAGRRRYLTDGKAISNVWTDINSIQNQPMSSQRTGYPTQKPVELLERIILTSSNPDDFVLDPFCGCATTCIAAERLDRRWIGIDVTEVAANLVKERLDDETKLGKLAEGIRHVHHCYFSDESQRPMRTDIVRKRSRNIKQILYGLQEGFCNLCPPPKPHFQIQHLEVDHIVPRAKGGLDIDANLQLLCGHCNRVKNDGTMQRARDRLRKLGYAA